VASFWIAAAATGRIAMTAHRSGRHLAVSKAFASHKPHGHFNLLVSLCLRIAVRARGKQGGNRETGRHE
jgi:hypothetical protein